MFSDLNPIVGPFVETCWNYIWFYDETPDSLFPDCKLLSIYAPFL